MLKTSFKRWLFLMATVILTTSAIAQALPRNANGELENSNAFAVAYAMSFQSFDSCGDRHHGEVIRRALAQEFDTCPFSARARAQFHGWSAVALPKMSAAIANGLKASQQVCSRVVSNPHYAATISVLDAYDRDPSRLPQAALIPCDQVPVYP